MHAAPHRNNSDFQLRHFLAGSCFTADGAWALLYNQKLDIQSKLEFTRARVLRRKAKLISLNSRSLNESMTQEQQLELEADWIEYHSGDGLLELAIAGAERELATITSLMAELEPQRQFAHLPLLEATEAAQRGEWLGEFKARIENFMFSNGTVPADQIEAMRKHPDFESEIVPHIRRTIALMQQSQDAIGLLKSPPSHLKELK